MAISIQPSHWPWCSVVAPWMDVGSYEGSLKVVHMSKSKLELVNYDIQFRSLYLYIYKIYIYIHNINLLAYTPEIFNIRYPAAVFVVFWKPEIAILSPAVGAVVTVVKDAGSGPPVLCLASGYF